MPLAACLSYVSPRTRRRCGSRATPTDPQTIGRELMVSWLLEGSVRKSGEMVRIAVQLVRAADGFSVWSGRFDRKLDDIFTVQDDIASMIAQTLTQRVAKAAGPLVTSKTSKTEAYYEIGVIHATLGDEDNAYMWLTRAVQERSGWIAYLRVDPRLDALHDDPRLNNVLVEARQ